MASYRFMSLTNFVLLLLLLLFLESMLLLRMQEAVGVDFRKMTNIRQDQIDLFFAWKEYRESKNNSKQSKNIKEITEITRYKFHLAANVELIGKFLYGPERGPFILNCKSECGMPDLDDLECAESMRHDILGQLGKAANFMDQPPKEHLVEKYFRPDNMSSGEKQKIELAKVRDEFKMSKSDCGSARVQVAQLTTKIKHLSSVCTKRKTLNEPSNQFSSLAYMGHAVPWTLALTLLLTWRSGVIPWTLL